MSGEMMKILVIKIVLLGLECRGQPASQRDITLLFLRAALGPGVGVVM